MFYTIISGVIVFIISQFFLELYLKPRMLLREKCGAFSKTMLLYHAEYINGVLIKEQREEISKASTELLGIAWIVYKKQRKRKIYLDIAKQVNLILAQSFREDKNYLEINEAKKLIEKLDPNIIISYAQK